MASSITAPITPAMMENIHPPLPAPPPMPRRLSSHPPRTAPTMPMMMVTIIPPGSSPGIANLASAPAISPTMRIEELEGGLPLHSQEAQQAEGYGLEGDGSQHNGQR